MKLLRTTISIFLFICISVYVYAADYYVISGGTGLQNGSDWDNALATIQEAIDLANANGEPDTIHVAAGTYNEHLNLGSDVTLLGGYPALGGAPEERDRIANPTYIDGSHSGRPVTIDGPSNITIDGFVIRNGSVTDDDGGGVHILSSSNIKIENNVIKENESSVTTSVSGGYGGGIGVNYGTSVDIKNNIIGGNQGEGNSSNGSGGGISFFNDSTGVISGNTISYNTASSPLPPYPKTNPDGGGIHIQNCTTGTVTVENNTISDNKAERGGGGMMIYSENEQVAKVIKKNIISGNEAGTCGGGIWIIGYCIINDNTITNNKAGSEGGGGIYLSSDEGGSITKNTITGNTAQSGGGGIKIAEAYSCKCPPGEPPTLNNPPQIGGAPEDCNHIYNNGNYDLYYYGCIDCTSPTLDATYNYWGTLDGGVIAARIDTAGTGSVNFTPWTNESCDMPLAVELSSFTAFWVDKNITLKWRTEAEVNNLGFNIYRSDTKDGRYTKVNSKRIAGAGTDATPHDYTFIDENVVKGFTYYYYIEDRDFAGNTKRSYIIEVTVGQQSIKPNPTPRRFALLQNYPNPFNPETWIPFQLAQDAFVSISIYDTEGQLVRTIALGNKNAGVYTTKEKSAYWDGKDSLGQKVASGVYFYSLKSGKFTATRKMIMLK